MRLNKLTILPLTLLLLLLTCFWSPVFAQVNQGRIKGFVYNPDKQPSEYSTVVLMNKDSVFMKGGLSATDGSFLFEGLDPASYLVLVRNVEYNTYISEPLQLDRNEELVLEPISLVTRVTDLEEVVIKGEKALVEVRADKMVYNVASSVNASGNNGLELLSKSPGVIVDLDNQITLQGKSGVRIFINGRPSRVSGSDLTNMLQGMRSDNIESIEIITNPSAKYEAEGTGGIINIILKKNTDLGFSGNVIGNFSQGVQPRTNVGTSLNYSGEKTSFFSTISLSRDEYKTDRAESILREDYFTDMDSREDDGRNGLNISAGVDHRFNSEHTLSVDARILINDRESYLESATNISDVTGALPPQLLLAETDGQGFSENYNANIHYSFVPNKSSSLTADLSFGLYSNSADTYQPNAYYDIGAEEPNRTVESTYDTNTGINLFSALLDYEKSIGKISISAGGKYSHISTSNQLAFYNIENDSATLDPNRSNDFSYLEQVVAAYLIFNAELTDRIAINAGLRVENTSSLGELVSATPSPDDVVPRNYTSYFPNISLSYNDQENHAISLSIGRRITRPNYQDLNPFERKLSEISAWRGNPFLEPMFTTNYQLTYSFKRKLVFSNTYSVSTNFFANIFEEDGDVGTVIIPRNMDNETNNGLSVSYPLKATKWWSFTTFLIYNHVKYSGDMEGTVIDLKADIVNFRMQNSFKLPLGITMELSAYASSPWIWRGSVHVNEYYRIDLGFKRAFLDDALLLNITGGDIFKSATAYPYNSDYGGMIVDGVITFDNQRVGFSLTYNFGNRQAKTSRKKKSAMDDELNRISD